MGSLMVNERFPYDRRGMDRTLRALGILLACLVLPSGCGKQEPAPYRDGLFLKYLTTIGGPMGLESGFSVQVRFSPAEGGKLKATFTTSATSPGAQVMVDSSGPMETLVDRYGRTDRGKPLFLIGLDEPPLWAPASHLKPGGTVGKGRFDQKQHWQKWEVWVAHPDLPVGSADWYYEAGTGFLVGTTFSSMGAGLSTMLVETNAEGL